MFSLLFTAHLVSLQSWPTTKANAACKAALTHMPPANLEETDVGEGERYFEDDEDVEYQEDGLGDLEYQELEVSSLP